MKQLERFFAKGNKEKLIELPLEEILRNPFQPRQEFNHMELKELAKSIQMYGIIQPVIVRKIRNGYQLIAGERRYRACRMIGKTTISAVVREMSDEKAAAVSLIENLQRKELNYFEEADAYARLLSEFGMTQDELAQRIGKSQSAIANKIRLLRLDDEVRLMIEPDSLSERHARALLKLNSVETQKEVLRAVYERELSVKETEDMVENLRHNNIPKETKDEDNGQSVSLIIRDARIFLNTIKETVNRARKSGINMFITENDGEDEYEILIRVPKVRNRLFAKG
ncbi:MAG: nucleoid occlusion protein [Syntrophomonas sp.]|nr:nucleoid occlusion protein [Syntrophomonas sp.]